MSGTAGISDSEYRHHNATLGSAPDHSFEAVLIDSLQASGPVATCWRLCRRREGRDGRGGGGRAKALVRQRPLITLTVMAAIARLRSRLSIGNAQARQRARRRA